MGWNGMGCWLLALGSTGRKRVEMSASSTATWPQRMNEAWFRAVRIRIRTQAQSAAAMCPQDQRMAWLEGWSTMLLLMLLHFVAASLLHVCQAMWSVGWTD